MKNFHFWIHKRHTDTYRRIQQMRDTGQSLKETGASHRTAYQDSRIAESMQVGRPSLYTSHTGEAGEQGCPPVRSFRLCQRPLARSHRPASTGGLTVSATTNRPVKTIKVTSQVRKCELRLQCDPFDKTHLCHTSQGCPEGTGAVPCSKLLDWEEGGYWQSPCFLSCNDNISCAGKCPHS